MLVYFLKRLGWAAVTLLGVSLLTFLVVFKMPADPAVVLAGRGADDPAVLASIRSRYGLDRPVWVQYGQFLAHLVQGDLGHSYMEDRPVAQAIAQRLPATMQLAVGGWLCWLLIGTLVGVWASSRPTTFREGTLLLFSTVGVSTPTFWVGIVLLYLFVTRLSWFPAGGSGTPRHLVLPVATLAVSGIAYYARLVHSSMADTLREDYIRTAIAKGAGRGSVLFRHALRNALLPLVTVAGADLAALLGGVVFTETVFGWDGMGKLAVDAVSYPDLPLIVGVVLISATFVVVANLVVDALYPLLDPRIRLR